MSDRGLPQTVRHLNGYGSHTLSSITGEGERLFPSNPRPDAYQEPISVGGPTEGASCREPPLKIRGDADRHYQREGHDDYTQPGNLFRLMTAEEQGRLFPNISEAMQGVPEDIVQRQLRHFYKADSAYGQGVAKAVGLEIELDAADEGSEQQGLTQAPQARDRPLPVFSFRQRPDSLSRDPIRIVAV